MEYFGKTFRKLRIEKGLTLAEFESLGISKSALAKFEREETSMGFNRVVSALEKMNIGLGEFELRTRYKYQLLLEIENAMFNQDVLVLQKIYNKINLVEEPLLKLSVISLLGKLDEDMRDALSEGLRRVTDWGYFELSLLLFVIGELETATISLIIEDATKKYLYTKECRERLLQIIYHAVALFSSRGSKHLAEELLTQSSKLEAQVGENLHLRMLRLLVEGYYEECYGNKALGIKLEKQILDYLNILGANQLSNYYNLYHYKWSGVWLE
jgi:Rgg/GadR/MutR family transcriptional activator